jgi:RNA polymerase sigma-70 factor (ECF subfamily)
MRNFHDIPSERLMERFQRGFDGGAMDEIVSRFMIPALATARQILSDPGLAEDAVQEAFLRVVRNHRQYDPRRPFAHWFYAVLRNACRDLRRRQSRHAQLVQQVAVEPDCRGEPRHADLPDVADLLGRLPEGERNVLVLRVVSGMRFDEIGIALGISEEAAKKRAQRGLRRLRRRSAALLEP